MKATTPASLNRVKFDAIISRDTSYNADVPEYPVEDGFYISDSVLQKPVELNVTAFVSDTPVTWKNQFGNTKGRLQRVIKMLEDLYFRGDLVTFTTSNRVYTGMAITSITIPETSEMKDAAEIPFTLKQVRVTKTKTTTIPDTHELGGGTEATGSVSTEEVSLGTTESTAYQRFEIKAKPESVEVGIFDDFIMSSSKALDVLLSFFIKPAPKAIIDKHIEGITVKQ